MKAQVKVSQNLTIEVEAENQKDLFKLIASTYEVFGEVRCGLCGSKSIRPRCRPAEGKNRRREIYEFPEWRCDGLVKNAEGKTVRCGAKLSLGTMNDGTNTLFPHRKLIVDKEPDRGRTPTKEELDKGISGKYGPHNGWTRYKGEKE